MGAPWEARADELEPQEHHWARYAAWEEWMQDVAPDAWEAIDLLDIDVKAELYSAFEKSAESDG